MPTVNALHLCPPPSFLLEVARNLFRKNVHLVWFVSWRYSYGLTFPFVVPMPSHSCSFSKPKKIDFYFFIVLSKKNYGMALSLSFLEDRIRQSLSFSSTGSETVNVYSVQNWIAVCIQWKREQLAQKSEGAVISFLLTFLIKSDGGRKKVLNALKGHGWLYENLDVVVTVRVDAYTSM